MFSPENSFSHFLRENIVGERWRGMPFLCDSISAHYAAARSVLSDKSRAVMEDNDSLTDPTPSKSHAVL